MLRTKCYVALGANLGSPIDQVILAFTAIACHSNISHARCAPLYETMPVSSIPQPRFINTVCSFWTTLSPEVLFAELEAIERLLGKQLKPKEAPRCIDIDLLFYGDLKMESPHLTLPHPRWQQRLFVLRPLADLTDDFGVRKHIQAFTNLHQESLVCLLPSSQVHALSKTKRWLWKQLSGSPASSNDVP